MAWSIMIFLSFFQGPAALLGPSAPKVACWLDFLGWVAHTHIYLHDTEWYHKKSPGKGPSVFDTWIYLHFSFLLEFTRWLSICSHLGHNLLWVFIRWNNQMGQRERIPRLSVALILLIKHQHTKNMPVVFRQFQEDDAPRSKLACEPHFLVTN